MTEPDADDPTGLRSQQEAAAEGEESPAFTTRVFTLLFAFGLGVSLGLASSNAIGLGTGARASAVTVGAILIVSTVGLIAPRPKGIQTRSERIQQLTVLLVTALVVVGIFAGVRQVQDRYQDLEALEGSYRIGVIPFWEDESQGSKIDRRAVIDTFQRNLVNDLNQGFDDSGIDGIGAQASLIQFAIEEDEITQPQVLADVNERVNANILLFGAVNQGVSGRIVLAPKVYISPSGLLFAEELVGIHDLTPIAEDLSRPGYSERLRDELRSVASDLSTLGQSLHAFDVGDYEHAIRILDESAIGDPTLTGIAHILAGNMYGKLAANTPGELGDTYAVAAADEYRAALSEPSVAHRAELGLAQVTFSAALSSSGDCTGDFDPNGLNAAIDSYESQRGAGTDDGANVGEKAAFGSARAHICRALGQDQPVPVFATADLTAVIEAFEQNRDDSDLRELASEAHGLLGTVLAVNATSDEQREEALDYLRYAVNLTIYNDRLKAFHLSQIRLLHEWRYPEAAVCGQLTEIRLIDDSAATQLVEMLAPVLNGC